MRQGQRLSRCSGSSKARGRAQPNAAAACNGQWWLRQTLFWAVLSWRSWGRWLSWSPLTSLWRGHSRRLSGSWRNRLCQHSLAQRRAVRWALLLAALRASRVAMARVLLVCQQGYPFGLRDWLHFFPVCLEPVNILVFFSSERRYGWVVNCVAELRPFDIRVFRWRLVSKLLLKSRGKIKAVILGWVSNDAGVDAGATLSLRMVDHTGLSLILLPTREWSVSQSALWKLRVWRTLVRSILMVMTRSSWCQWRDRDVSRALCVGPCTWSSCLWCRDHGGNRVLIASDRSRSACQHQSG